MPKKELTIQEMPSVPEGAVFKLVKIETIWEPHPYCISPRHVAIAANFGGILGEEAIICAERKGVYCDTCKQNGHILKYEEHKHYEALFIEVPQNKDLNAIPGLHTYLHGNKQRFIDLGIGGFAFPKA